MRSNVNCMFPGGSGKRSLPMVLGMRINAIGKLRRLRLPLPPDPGDTTRKQDIINRALWEMYT